MKLIKTLAKALREAAKYNPDAEIPPLCVLWTDGDRQFESSLPQLRKELPELLTWGDYDVSLRRGPAIWIRCALDGMVPEFSVPGKTPIVYLPGISRPNLRKTEEIPAEQKPLVFLQFRGAYFSQVNGKDWTLNAFLVANKDLKLNVATDEASKKALLQAFPLLLDLEVSALKNHSLDKDYFNNLLTDGDSERMLLQYLDSDDTWKDSLPEAKRNAFLSLCQADYGFDPIVEGKMQGLELFAERQGAWKRVFDRYAEACLSYPNIEQGLRGCNPVFDFFGSAEKYGGWPQWNDDKEKELFGRLKEIQTLSPEKVAAELKALEETHGARRELPWAKQGKSSGAKILPLLQQFTALIQENYFHNTYEQLAEYYEKNGHQIDALAWKILSMVQDQTYRETTAKLVRNLYEPWLHKTAFQLQTLFTDKAYPAAANEGKPEPGTCLLFVDALRLDLAVELKQKLEGMNLKVSTTTRWAPLPTITPTGKPAAVPQKVENPACPYDEDLSPLDGKPFDKYLETFGIHYDCDDPQYVCWKQYGGIDSAGHDHKEDMPLHIGSALDEICSTVKGLLEKGFSHVRIVTDHGWLHLPGGLPKATLPRNLTEDKWGRYALPKPEAEVTGIQATWFWNPDVTILFPNGVHNYRAGMVFAHGGISLQECRLMELTVTSGAPVRGAVRITESRWAGLRLKFKVEGDYRDCSADLRSSAENSGTTLIAHTKDISDSGTCSLPVEDDSHEGEDAYLVILDENEKVIAQKQIKIGE